MKIAFYMNAVSTHQLPLAREVAKRVGYENFVYVDAGEVGQAHQTVSAEQAGVRILNSKDDPSSVQLELETSTILYTGGIRPIDLMERRAAKGLKTFYASERWFKPWRGLPGWARMLVPSYRRMAKRFVKLVNENDCVKFLSIGPHAAADFKRLRVREEKMVPWGYFVEPSVSRVERVERVEKTLRVLWAGRDIPLKHVSDIERAVVLANKNLTSALHLHLDSTPISFTKLTGVTPAEVRAAMREHDTFVFASNGYEGWGAVVSEALEEGMNVICSSDCGSGPTLLPRARLFKCGDVGALAKLLEAEYRGELPPCTIGDWTAAKAAERLLASTILHG